MIQDFVIEHGLDIDLYARKLISSGIDRSYSWVKERSFKGIITLQDRYKNKVNYNEKAVEDSTHYLYTKPNTILKSDLESKLILETGDEFFISYIDNKLNRYSEEVNHQRVFISRAKI